MTKEDDDIAAYQARLKKTSFRLSPVLVLSMAIPVAVIATLVIQYRMNQPAEVDTAASATPPPPTEAELAARPLQPIADEYAAIDPQTLPAGDLALAKGRKVVFVEQSLDLDPSMARVLGSGPRMARKRVFLPEGFTGASAGPFARSPGEAGIVVLLRTAMHQTGTYTGGNEPAIDLDYSGEAILVPERSHVAKIHHHVSAPPTATRFGGGLLVGDQTRDDGAWLRDVATALADGRAPPM